MTPRKALLTPAVVSLVLVSAVAYGGPAAAATPPPAPSTVSFCQNVPDVNPFTDVSPSSPHYDNILCLAYAGITAGTSPTTYDPTAPVRRDQMASFIARTIDKMNRLETGTKLRDMGQEDHIDDFWDDVPDSNVHKLNINRLFEDHIVNGTGFREYSPANPVRREQMTSFINRAEEYLTGTAFSTTDDYFTDDETSGHEDNINGVASVGIAQGKSATTFAPGDVVTREQMASFIVRWFALHEDAGDITPLPPDIGPDLLSSSGIDVDKDGTFNKGDQVVLTFADPVVLKSSITITDGLGTYVILSDDPGAPANETASTFALSADGRTVTITPTKDVILNGGNSSLSGEGVTITGASGIDEPDTNDSWNPDKEPDPEVHFEFEPAP